MKLTARKDPYHGQHYWIVRLHDVERNAIVEVRVQNTMTGKQIDQYIESDNEGLAVIDLPDFGQHYAITLRVLTENNREVLHRLYFDPTDSLTKLSMSSNPETITQAANGALPKEVSADV